MPSSQSKPLGAIVLLLAALVGAAVAGYAYVTPLTGVNGSLGALVVIFACLALALMALILMPLKHRGGRIFWRLLALIGLIGTGFAGLLLHQWGIAAAMVLGLIGLILDLRRPTTTRRAAHA
ncbi:hypothetical protein [Salinicola sp. DM10]|uniref:hypothetical protein n=1 Tax=Salinicola sp. DM10 TaxID=2815721 RepID=UPI001A8D6A99|nr:hypothetical protein [Salinicola sp. DM10]MCE3026169.1 hypothetical protein [Salinicola sp. DM10]